MPFFSGSSFEEITLQAPCILQRNMVLLCESSEDLVHISSLPLVARESWCALSLFRVCKVIPVKKWHMGMVCAINLEEDT
ncbi:hypothetical protein CFP56_007708 [Quercus suber]|uniref:Uncharacterized protein n=1 Tax=Quercus suber TaxID=58331 RepID=A0AAW0M8Q3_QUESU